MWDFKAEQKKFDIGGNNIGGVPGERPVVLIGSIFYHGHKVVIDEEKGEFKREAAEGAIKLQEEFSDRTGNPCMLDVVGATPEAIVKYLDFVASVTEVPQLLDGITLNTKLAALEYVKKSGLSSRVIYNSLTPHSKQEEYEKVVEAGVKSAILLALYTKDFTSKGRVTATTEILLPSAEKAGINKPLIDTCVVDLASFGSACRAIYDIKAVTGLPAGCGAHNAITIWRGLKQKMGLQAVKPCVAAISAATAAVGADFVFYGPIEDAPYVFPAVGMMDTAYSQIALEHKKRLDRKHPRFRIG